MAAPICINCRDEITTEQHNAVISQGGISIPIHDNCINPMINHLKATARSKGIYLSPDNS